MRAICTASVGSAVWGLRPTLEGILLLTEMAFGDF